MGLLKLRVQLGSKYREAVLFWGMALCPIYDLYIYIYCQSYGSKVMHKPSMERHLMSFGTMAKPNSGP